MKRFVLLTALAVALVWLYADVYMWVIGYVSVRILTPPNIHAAIHSGGVVLLRSLYFATDLLVTLVVSVPFAYVIARLYGTAWLVVAILVAGFLAAQDLFGIPVVWGHIEDHQRYLIDLVVGTARLLLVLPALTYVAWRLTSGKRWMGP